MLRAAIIIEFIQKGPKTRGNARTIVPRDHGWFNTAASVKYFFPNPGGSFENTPRQQPIQNGKLVRDNVLGRERNVGMLMSSKLAAFARSFSICSSYCSVIPARQFPAGVARIRASCAVVREAPLGERRAREPVPMPRMERRKRPLRSSLQYNQLSAEVVGYQGGLLESELFFENGLVGDGI